MPSGCDFLALQKNFKTDLHLRAVATGGFLASKRRGVSIKLFIEVFHTDQFLQDLRSRALREN